MLVVIAIIAILAALVVPSVQQALTSANFAKATGNMRSLAGAVHLYAADNQGTFPRMRGEGANNWAAEGLWVTAVAPYAIGKTNTPSAEKIYLNPLEKIHGSRGDFGCNSYVFAQDKETNSLQAVRMSSISKPSKTIMLSMARERRVGGVGGTWYVESETFVELGSNSPSAKPSDLNLGKIAFVNIDGSSATMAWDEFVERREELLNPEKAK